MRLAGLICLGVLTAAGDGAAAQSRNRPDVRDGASGSQAATSTRDAAAAPDWTVQADGALFATFNEQGGRRGERDVRSQNWLMVMGRRRLGPGMLTATGMFSAEPFTVGAAGYSEVFQEGEVYRGLQMTDHQHPHDLFMQLSAAWRIPLGDRSSVTVAGGPVGEATLGPVAFMHRPSSSENPSAPLSHHIFDSTHISSGVAMIRFDRGVVAVEGSVFRGREPDEHRYDLEFGALDSWAIRAWLTPGPEWTIQASHGFLRQPEALEPGNQRRTNGSVSWLRQRSSGFTAVTGAFGRNTRQYSVVDAVLFEGTHRTGRTSLYARFEQTDIETEILLFPQIVHVPHPGELVDPVRAFTAGATRDVAQVRGLAVGIGGDAAFYGVPSLLQVTHGQRPLSFHVFLRISRAGPTNRMWNSTMGADGHASMGHVHR